MRTYGTKGVTDKSRGRGTPLTVKSKRKQRPKTSKFSTRSVHAISILLRNTAGTETKIFGFQQHGDLILTKVQIEALNVKANHGCIVIKEGTTTAKEPEEKQRKPDPDVDTASPSDRNTKSGVEYCWNDCITEGGGILVENVEDCGTYIVIGDVLERPVLQATREGALYECTLIFTHLF
jgi:hypothetical protein